MSVARTAMPSPAAPLSDSSGLHKYRPLLLAASAVGTFCIAADVFGWGGLSQSTDLGSISLEVLIVLSTTLFFLSALAQPVKWRRPWILVGVGLFAVLIGTVVSALYSLTIGHVPSPSLADVFYLAFYPIIMTGLLQFPRAVTTKTEAVGFALDAVAVLFGSGMLVAYGLIVPRLESYNGNLPSLLVGIALPLGDVLLVFGLVSLVVRGRSLPRDASVAALAAALVLLLISDLLYSYQGLNGSVNGSLQNFLAASSWVLVAWAGYERLRQRSAEGPEHEIVIPSLFGYLVAYGTAMAGFGVLLVAARSDLDSTLGIMIIAAVTVTPLLLARQVLALRESTKMYELKGSHETEERFHSLVTNSLDAIFVTDQQMAIQFATPSAQTVFGYAPETLSGRKLEEFVHPDDQQLMMSLVNCCSRDVGSSARGEWRMCDQEGAWHFTETVVANLLEDQHVRSLVFTTRDIGERVHFQSELQHQAFHDALTGLANRVLFQDRVDHALRHVSRTHDNIAVLFMDIDDFKLINDSYGHLLGDRLLVDVAHRLAGVLRSIDTAARLGGDEFAVLLEGPIDLGNACLVAQRTLRLFDESFALDLAEPSVSVSIGVAVSDGSHESAEQLLRDADVAMYSAKSHGKNRLEVFEPAMQEAVYERVELATNLRSAVDRSEFVVHYQPIVEIATERIVGAEALVRWNHPRSGLIYPDGFIHVAEETGLITAIGEFVLDEACEQLRRWDEEFPAHTLRMAVNISPRQLKDAELVEKVRSALGSSGVDPARLTLEITEGALVDDSHATLTRLRELKALGINLSIDDFGTGYSSLSYLRQFPVDGVKIAKPFVDHIAEGDDNSALARAIISLGGTLRLEVVAEGIEQEQQMKKLRALGCQFGQGFYSSRPLSAQKLSGLLARSRHADAT
jgi:diguanylate cyclase (GGDEF)-like protein/PAS domain S-box-containing protein